MIRLHFGTLISVAASVSAGVGGLWGWQDGLGPDQVAFLSVGQGDCAVIRSEGHALLVDAGPKTPFSDAGERLVLPKLRSMGIDSVDLILLSHPDADHVGGAGAVLHAFPNCRIAMSSQFRHTDEMDKWFLEWRLDPARVIWLNSQGTIGAGSAAIRYACPILPPGGETNDGSMFLHVAFGTAAADFSGDAPVAVEDEIARSGDWRADVLKAGHHGSRTATGDTWLDAVRPRLAILSVGRDNRYGHPHRETLERLRSHHVPWLRTDRDGDLVFEPQNGRLVRVGR